MLTVNKAAPKGAQPDRSSQPPRTSSSATRIYVGNLPWTVDNARLEQIFSEHGKVVEARVVYDRESGRSRGFGFVTMASEADVNDAIAALDGQVKTPVLYYLIICGNITRTACVFHSRE